jgi:hypothetical protein
MRVVLDEEVMFFCPNASSTDFDEILYTGLQ